MTIFQSHRLVPDALPVMSNSVRHFHSADKTLATILRQKIFEPDNQPLPQAAINWFNYFISISLGLTALKRRVLMIMG